MTDIRVGDKVRTPQGRIFWTVTRVDESHGLPVAWMRSDHGTTQRYRLDRLRRAESSPTPDDRSDVDSCRWEARANGQILCNGQAVSDPDHYVHTTVEWAWPNYGRPDPYNQRRPRAVTAQVCSADDNGDRWLTLAFTEPTEGGTVGLRKDAVLELGFALVKMASYLGQGYTPGR